MSAAETAMSANEPTAAPRNQGAAHPPGHPSPDPTDVLESPDASGEGGRRTRRGAGLEQYGLSGHRYTLIEIVPDFCPDRQQGGSARREGVEPPTF
jgi:hypothetical protein